MNYGIFRDLYQEISRENPDIADKAFSIIEKSSDLLEAPFVKHRGGRKAINAMIDRRSELRLDI